MLFAMPLFKNFYLRDKARISIPSTTIVDSLPKCPQKPERLKLENQFQLYPLSSRDPNTRDIPAAFQGSAPAGSGRRSGRWVLNPGFLLRDIENIMTGHINKTASQSTGENI